MKYYILFGPPGAGKGTQASAMVQKYNLCHLSTGELLRSEIAAGTELGLRAKALIEAGSLVPDEVVEGMIEAKFKGTEGVEGFLLDGFPRTIAQAEALDAMLAKTGEAVTAVVSIMIPDQMIHERIAHRATITRKRSPWWAFTRKRDATTKSTASGPLTKSAAGSSR